MIEIDQAKSIISVTFQVEAYDIQIGLYRAMDTESIYEIQNEGEENETIVHPLDKMEVVLPMRVVECNEKMVKITFIAKEPGFYKLVFSNEHSWMRGK